MKGNMREKVVGTQKREKKVTIYIFMFKPHSMGNSTIFFLM